MQWQKVTPFRFVNEKPRSGSTCAALSKQQLAECEEDNSGQALRPLLLVPCSCPAAMSRALTEALPSALKVYIANVKGDFGAVMERVRASQPRLSPGGGASVRRSAFQRETSQKENVDSRGERGEPDEYPKEPTASPSSKQSSGGKTPVLGNVEGHKVLPLVGSPPRENRRECEPSRDCAKGIMSLDAERRRRKDEKRQQKLRKKIQQASQRQQRERELQEKKFRQTCLDERLTLEVRKSEALLAFSCRPQSGLAVPGSAS